MPGRRGHGFRVHTPRQVCQESIDAPAVTRLLLYINAGNMPSVRRKRAREAYRSQLGALHSSTAGRHRRSRPQFSPAAIPQRNFPSSRTPSPKDSTDHGPPGADECLRLQQIQNSRPTLSLGSKCCCGTNARTYASSQERECRRCIEKFANGGESSGGDTSLSGTHDSFKNRTTGSSQEGMRRLVPGRRGHGFRVRTARHLRHESLDAPAVTRLLLYINAGNVRSVRSKRARTAYRSRSSAPRSSTSVRHRTCCPPLVVPRTLPPPANRRCTSKNRPCNRTPPPTCSIGDGAPGTDACLRLRQNQTSRPTLSLGRKFCCGTDARTRANS